tara:strand:+ start:357 stop:503 length:147 start_codon:yes stop_codon:yes gene_type:complete
MGVNRWKIKENKKNKKNKQSIYSSKHIRAKEKLLSNTQTKPKNISKKK